jgi:ParB family chromosome partitioning protein
VANRIIKNNLTVKETEKLIDDIIEKVQQKDEAKSKGSIRNFINYKIYVNTIKHAYKEILKTGVSANFEEKEYEDHIEVLVRIPKNS